MKSSDVKDIQNLCEVASSFDKSKNRNKQLKLLGCSETALHSGTDDSVSIKQAFQLLLFQFFFVFLCERGGKIAVSLSENV
jgi:hypothetical protein